MRKSQTIMLVLLPLLFAVCNEKAEKPGSLEPQVHLNELTADFSQWWAYYSINISLSSDFIGLSENSDTIDKRQFLVKLTSGDFIPLKLKSNDRIDTYKLYKLDSLADEGIASTIKNQGATHLKHFNMVGKPFPEFDFTDLAGNHFTNESTKGKTLVFKTWFIGCTACVAEFPELNELAENQEVGSDMVFIGLALDPIPELEKFLSKKPFKYHVVPEKRDFIEKALNLQIYPTHIIVDENGTILKVVNKASEMISFLEIEKKPIE